jgi:hypothetical protein
MCSMATPMGEKAPSVWDYTRAEWMARDSRRELAYECARKLGCSRDHSRRTADAVASKEPGSDSPPRSAGRPSRHVSRSTSATGGGLANPFPWIRFPDASDGE